MKRKITYTLVLVILIGVVWGDSWLRAKILIGARRFYFTKNEFFKTAAARMNMNTGQLTQYLWDKYHPASFWYVVAGIGIVASAVLFFYDQFIIKRR